MKYIKLFESDSNKPKIGDYVICKDDGETEISIMINKFLSENIGQIFQISKSNNFIVEYKNVPPELKHFFDYFHNHQYGFRIILVNEVIFFSSYRRDCEIYTDTNKYNL